MRRFSFVIAASLLVGLFSGGVYERVEKLGIQVWLQTKMEASDNTPRMVAINQDQ
jgi:hypothetical protein